MEVKERKKAIKEITTYMIGLLEHLSHHCCAVDPGRHNEIVSLLYRVVDE